MTKDTQWMVDLLSGKAKDDPVDNYTKLVNRRGLFDDIGEAFAEQSKQPAVNGKQRMTNALMAGVGAGMKGSQTQLREAKLQELEEDLKQVAGYRVGLQKQLGAQQLKTAAFSNYASNNYGDFKKLNDAFGSGDQQTANSLGILLYNRFKAENPDIGAKMPPIDHIYNGKAYLGADDKSQTVFMKDLLAPLVSTLPPELQKEIPNLTTLTMQNKFKQSDLLDNLAIEKERANIGSLQSSANLDNAQAGKIGHEMNAPKPKYSDQVSAHMYKTNMDWVNGLRGDHDLLKQEQQAYEKIGELIAKESEWHGRAGKGVIEMAQRVVNKAGTESEKNQALIELYKQPLMAGIKKIFAGATSDYDIATYVAGLPSLDKNPQAAIQIAKERAARLAGKIRDDELTAEILENEFGYGEPYQSRAVQDKVKARKANTQSSSNQNSQASSSKDKWFE